MNIVLQNELVEQFCFSQNKHFKFGLGQLHKNNIKFGFGSINKIPNNMDTIPMVTYDV